MGRSLAPGARPRVVLRRGGGLLGEALPLGGEQCFDPGLVDRRRCRRKGPAGGGMRLPVLRETRMPAVLVTIGPVRVATDATPQLATAVLRALDLWILREG